MLGLPLTENTGGPQPNGATRAIFVVGYMHSGTTMVMNALRASPQIYSSKGETKFFEVLPMLREAYPDLSSPNCASSFLRFVAAMITNGFVVHDQGGSRAQIGRDLSDDPHGVDYLVERLRDSREHAAAFPLVFDHLAGLEGKTLWLEKTPTHIFHLDTIARVIPSAQFVEVVREPRDVLASKKTRVRTVESDRYREDVKPLKRLEKSYDPVWDTLSWRSAVRTGRDAVERCPARVLRVRYEDLVTEPEARLTEVFSWLGLPLEDRNLQVAQVNPADITAAGRSGISSGSIGRWKKVLTPAEAALSISIAGREAELAGYERHPPSMRTVLAMVPLLAKAGVEFCLRLYKRWRLGGWRFLRNVLASYGLRGARLLSSSRSRKR
jgi:hypothetical protein